MRILAVDTSSERGSICVAEDGVVLGEIRLASSIQYSERLFRSLEFLLDYLPFGLGDVDIFAAARGPGSFTGLRVGLAAMEGFAASFGRIGRGVSTLEALAWKTGVKDELIAPTIDARRGEVYGALYRCTPDRVIEQIPPVVYKAEHWFEILPEATVRFCGSGAERYRDQLNRPGWVYENMDLYLAGAVADLAPAAGGGSLEPLYVRRTDAEIAREGHHASLAGPGTKS